MKKTTQPHETKELIDTCQCAEQLDECLNCANDQHDEHCQPRETKQKRQIIYKKVKVAMPHCFTCGERLDGNGSINTPYKCSCGEWRYDGSVGEWNII